MILFKLASIMQFIDSHQFSCKVLISVLFLNKTFDLFFRRS